MGIFTGTIFSGALNMDTSIAAIIPHDSRSHRDDAAPRSKPRTLILLHGLTDNFAAWAYRSRILSYAEDHDVAVIMPEVQRSYYQDMVYGEAYFTYVSEELPKLAGEMFNISVEPEDLMVAGLSMGGYGALRCGLSHPERYRAVGAFSSASDVEALTVRRPDRKETMNFAGVVKGMFTEKLVIPEEARLDVLAKRAAGSKLPVMMTCGTEDELYPMNAAFYETLKTNGFDVTFDAWQGIHEWGFWDKSIAMFLDRFAE